MTRIGDGGPAYPAKALGYNHGDEFCESDPASQGMTLRDYFAAQAMHAWMINEPHHDTGECAIADLAYSQADAMLVKRLKP